MTGPCQLTAPVGVRLCGATVQISAVSPMEVGGVTLAAGFFLMHEGRNVLQFLRDVVAKLIRSRCECGDMRRLTPRCRAMMRMLSIVVIVLGLSGVGCSSRTSHDASSPQPERPTEPAKVSDASTAPAAATSAEQAPAQESAPAEETMTGSSTAPVAGQAGPTAQASASGAALDPAVQAQIGQWLDQMASEAEVERRAASDALSEQGEAAVPYLVWGLREGTQRQKCGAATYLIGRVGPRDEPVVRALIDALTHADVPVQRLALQAVERLSQEQLREALPALDVVAREPELGEAYRSRAVRAIAKLGPDGAPALETLETLAQEGDDLNVRRACYFAITKVAPATAAEAFFQKQLTSDIPADLRRLSAKWLGTVTRSEASLEGLVKALGDPDESVRLEAGDALVAIGKPAVKPLIEALDSADVVVRRHAVLTLGKMGYFANQAIGPLEARLNDADPQVRELAAAALQLIKTQ